MGFLVGFLLLGLFCGIIFKLVFGILGLAFRAVFGIVGFVLGLIGFVFGGGIIAALILALIGGIICIPISLFGRR